MPLHEPIEFEYELSMSSEYPLKFHMDIVGLENITASCASWILEFETLDWFDAMCKV